MNILISNDDGIAAQGLRELAKALSKRHMVYVSAPADQRSAASQWISVRKRMHFKEQQVPGAEKAWAIDGTPADATKVGLSLCEREGVAIDIVFSGINHGGNYGFDTLYSGTLGAAREANFGRKPAVALSVNSHEPQHGFGYICDLAVKLADRIEEELRKVKGSEAANVGGSEIEAAANAGGAADTAIFGDCSEALREILTDHPRTISINVPDLPPGEIKGLKVATIGPRDYDELIHTKSDEEGEYFEYDGNVVVYGEDFIFEGAPIPKDCDVMLMQEGYATLSILGYDLTDHCLTDLWRL